MEETVFDIYKADCRVVERAAPPRTFKSHQAFDPSYRRMVYIVRDPGGVALSYLNYLTATGSPLGRSATSEHGRFVDAFLQGQIDGFGNWQEHVLSWLITRGPSSDVLLVRYEDLVQMPEYWLEQVLGHFDVRTPLSLGEIVSMASPEQLVRLELDEDRQWRKFVRIREGTFFGGAARSQRAVERLDAPLVARIHEAFEDAMKVAGYSG